MPKLNVALIVIKTRDLELVKRFYGYLGFNFQEIVDGKGRRDYHYASIGSEFILELRPLEPYSALLVSHVRLGFFVENIHAVVGRMHLKGIELAEPLQATEQGSWHAIVQDPDGRHIELFEAPKR